MLAPYSYAHTKMLQWFLSFCNFKLLPRSQSILCDFIFPYFSSYRLCLINTALEYGIPFPILVTSFIQLTQNSLHPTLLPIQNLPILQDSPQAVSESFSILQMLKISPALLTSTQDHYKYLLIMQKLIIKQGNSLFNI